MNKPILSKDFTVEDIHKLREYNYLRRRKMTDAEVAADTDAGAKQMQEMILAAKKKNKNVI